jgi:hypothetical protein
VAANAHRASLPGAIDVLSFATPFWLAGLLLIPIIRQFHRSGPNVRSFPVSSLMLWQRESSVTPAAGKNRPPDPVWRRRALLTALLFITLAGPQLAERGTRITLWVDDSMSMLTRETGGTRLEEGIARVRSALADGAGAEIEVRSLTEPWQSMNALNDSTPAKLTAAAGRKEPGPPPASLLRPDRLHWLLTDGADPAVFDWPDGRHPDRTFTIGRITRNIGLERLSARRNLTDPEKYDVLVKVTNGGTAAEVRDVLVATDAGEISRSSERIDAGAFALLNVSIPASNEVRVRLEPADALTADDEIVLDLESLRKRRVALDPGCPTALSRALEAHPALVRVAWQSSSVDALITCAAAATAANVPKLHVSAGRMAIVASRPLRWSSAVAESRRISVEPEALQSSTRLDVRPDDTVLLASGDDALIVRRAGASTLIETALDFTSSRFVHRPEFPLIVQFLTDELFGTDLLNRIASVDRGRAAVKVAPVIHTEPSSDRRASPDTQVRAMARPFLILALFVLLWEMIGLGRKLRRIANDRRNALA